MYGSVLGEGAFRFAHADPRARRAPDHHLGRGEQTLRVYGDLAGSGVADANVQALALNVREGRKLGMPIEYVHAHRQSSATRRADPGEELWKRVVLEFGVPVLGLTTEPARTLPGRNGDGRPIPLEWDPDGVGSY